MEEHKLKPLKILGKPIWRKINSITKEILRNKTRDRVCLIKKVMIVDTIRSQLISTAVSFPKNIRDLKQNLRN